MTKRTAVRTTLRAVATGAFATTLLGLAPQTAVAAPVPTPQAPARASVAAAHEAAAAPATLDTLARFFAADRKRGGAPAMAPAAPGTPRIEGGTVPVYLLSPDFVRGRTAAPVARLEFLASKAVAADGRTASVWTVRQGAAWKVVNIADGDDETRYTAAGAARAKGGTVFHEPQIDAWYVQRGDRIEPLDADARKAVGAHGTTVAAYRKRVAKAYGDKLPGSAYDRRGEAGGYGPKAAAGGEETRAQAAPAQQPVTAGAFTDDSLPVTAATTVAGAAALLALGLSAAAALRRRRSG
ncbi:hypothetical protein ACWCYK_24285 [Streptomyces lydicamycinicus]|uniref:Gram-positive cocci surface proteins LPxTG domain-containing protein n=1 Tax=Streptomyces lydicamycinicus TaxID=1546107 RepID=A0A0P4RGN9_9ACTN|nr:hypothetical protein [Streptomyces lydicamycinicus]GAO12575.1 hypothetical protein TPA0598_11_01360 [Streptomyces lydicamycinicus]